jgi:outer membrane protein assembly factor BamB
MVAVELITGQRAWEVNIGGLSTPWVAGDWIFVVTDRAQLLAVARSSGRIRWISQLPRYHNERKHEGPIYWRGPVLAGNRLILTGSNGNIIYASPVDGSVQTTVEHHAQMSLPPIVSNSTLLVLDNEGKLTAWR